MILSFVDQGTEDVFDGKKSKRAGKTCPAGLWNIARRKLDQVNRAKELSDLRSPPGNHLERLGADRIGQHSIRINDQYRICFVWTSYGPYRDELTDYH